MWSEALEWSQYPTQAMTKYQQIKKHLYTFIMHLTFCESQSAAEFKNEQKTAKNKKNISASAAPYSAL